MALVGTLIGLGSALVGGIFGGGQKRRANRLEANNPFPEAQVNENLISNLTRASQLAGVGLPQEQYNRALQNIQRAQNAGLRTASRNGGTGSIASIVRAATDATGQLDVADANARRQNQLLEMQQAQILAQEENRVWGWNEQQRYINTANQVAQLRRAGDQNIFGSLGLAAQIGLMGANGGGSAGQQGLGGVLGNIFGGARGRVSSVPLNTGVQTMGVTSPTSLPLGIPTSPLRRTL